MSKTHLPEAGSVSATGRSVRVTRIGGAAWASSRPTGSEASTAGVQAASSNPGRSHPAISLRASYSSPR